MGQACAVVPWCWSDSGLDWYRGCVLDWDECYEVLYWGVSMYIAEWVRLKGVLEITRAIIICDRNEVMSHFIREKHSAL